ncbi:Clp protease N-terminal domain-containing protein [Dactylosporangium salmoneum]|uniref:Clp R domain-containing protein n=1 Tax=Dactylosporangium salmoneum TaxID=53361 RepID=A0ABP5UFF4_9ACTN
MSSGVVASHEIVVGLGESCRWAGLAGAPVVNAERVADVLLGWVGAMDVRWEVAPGFGASGEAVPLETEDEVDATLRLAEWHARGRLRRPFGAPVPGWDERIRVALGRALAAAAEGDIRYVGFKLMLRSLLAECDSPGEWMEFVRRFHLRPDAEFLADGSPDAARGLELLGGPARGIAAAVRREAVRQAVRGGCTLVGQAHLVMAMCALNHALERTGGRPAGGGPQALAARGIGYPEVKGFAEELSFEVGDPPKQDRTWWRGREDPAFAADVVRAFADADRLAADLGQPAAGTVHLLYVIVADTAGPGALMLRSLGADPAALAVDLGQQLSAGQ